MNILLMMPPDLYVAWPFANDFTRSITRIPAVTLPQLAASLSSIPDVKVKIWDGLVEPFSLRRYRRLIQWADLIGMKVEAEVTALNSELNLRFIKKVHPTVTVVLGGTHPTLLHRAWCQKGADVVVRGDGEHTFPALVQHIQEKLPLKSVPGITFRKGREIVVNEDAAPVESLDDTPLPRWDKLNLARYNLDLIPSGKTASLETARGCTFHCSYCAVPVVWQGKQRFKSFPRMIAEVEQLYHLGVRQIAIVDDNFGVALKRDELFLEEILRRGYPLAFGCFMRADTVRLHTEHIKLMAQAGLKTVYMGFESVDEQQLRKYRKGYRSTKADDFRQIYAFLHSLGIFVVGLFVSGAPEERKAALVRSHDFTDISSFSNLRPVPATPMYTELKKSVRLKDMFYHDRYFPAFTFRDGRPQFNSTRWNNLYNNFHPSKWASLLFGSYLYRRYWRRLYGALWKNTRQISFRKVRNFLYSLLPIPVEKRQEKWLSYNLDQRFIHQLLKRSE